MVHSPPGYDPAHQRLGRIRADGHGLLQDRSRHIPPNLRLQAGYRRRQPRRGRIGEPDDGPATLARWCQVGISGQPGLTGVGQHAGHLPGMDHAPGPGHHHRRRRWIRPAHDGIDHRIDGR